MERTPAETDVLNAARDLARLWDAVAAGDIPTETWVALQRPLEVKLSTAVHVLDH